MDFQHMKGKAKKLNIVEGQLERIEPDIGAFPPGIFQAGLFPRYL